MALGGPSAVAGASSPASAGRQELEVELLKAQIEEARMGAYWKAAQAYERLNALAAGAHGTVVERSDGAAGHVQNLHDRNVQIPVCIKIALGFYAGGMNRCFF